MNGQYECLNPWAEVDPIPLRGISPRLTDLAGKKIGILANLKVAAIPIATVVEKRLKERFPDLETAWFESDYKLREVSESLDRAKFEEWIKGCDALIGLIGD